MPDGFKEVEIFQPKSIQERFNYSRIPKISEHISGHLSPKKIRELANEYQAAGIDIVVTPGLPFGNTELTTGGKIKTHIPEIIAYGNEGVAVHEFTHVEQYVNALQTLTTQEILSSPPHIMAMVEIGALEIQLQYLNTLPWQLKRQPAYKQAIQEAEKKLASEKQKLPQGTVITENDKLHPFNKIISV